MDDLFGAAIEGALESWQQNITCPTPNSSLSLEHETGIKSLIFLFVFNSFAYVHTK